MAAWIGTLSLLLTACTTPPPDIAYDADVPPLPAPPPIPVETGPEPLHRPPAIRPARGGAGDAAPPLERVATANAAARIEPRRGGYFNAVQVYAFSPGALYRIYATPGRITEITLEHGEQLVGEGPIAAGDTARWIIGDTISGTGDAARVHVLIKPTRPEVETNLILNTDRRTYHLELIATDDTHMPSVAWFYPESRPRSAAMPTVARPTLPAPSRRNHRYTVTGDSPPWRPRQVFDDGRRTYVVFPRGIVQGEMPPLFVLGPDGAPEIANTRVIRNVLVVDRLFAAAELRLGVGRSAQAVRITRRTDIPPALVRYDETGSKP
ncbi:MAG: P-type conjugative transfer protein TrbG [Pseudomonadota bacterium]